MIVTKDRMKDWKEALRQKTQTILNLDKNATRKMDKERETTKEVKKIKKHEENKRTK